MKRIFTAKYILSLSLVLLLNITFVPSVLGYVTKMPNVSDSVLAKQNLNNTNLESEITLGDFIKLLFASNNLNTDSVTLNDLHNYDDVPGEFATMAEQARRLRLVPYVIGNPVFGYHDKMQISRVLDLSLKYYGLSSGGYVHNRELFQEKIKNFSPDFIHAPLIEKSVTLNLLKPINGNINFNSLATYEEALSIILQVQNIAQKLELVPAMPSIQTTNTSINTAPITDANNITLKIFNDVYKRLTNNYYFKDTLDLQDLIYGAISGLVEKVEDPYTTFDEPSATDTITNSLSNHIEGIGASLTLDDKKRVVIVAPLKGSPAEKAGLQPNDVILKIDNTSVTNLSLKEVTDLIKGSAGSRVTLTIQRQGSQRVLSIVRSKITVPIVQASIVDNVAVLSIMNFGLGLEDNFRRFLTQVMEQNVKGIVIDVRNNPGGYLESATRIAEHFLAKDTTVSQVEYVNNRVVSNKTQKSGSAIGKPLVVVINNGTASAAEILAAALRDNANAKLVGTKSFGKGTVQELITYSDDSALKLTVAKWRTPKGINIDKVGLTPDFHVVNSENDTRLGNDAQLNKAINYIKQL